MLRDDLSCDTDGVAPSRNPVAHCAAASAARRFLRLGKRILSALNPRFAQCHLFVVAIDVPAGPAIGSTADAASDPIRNAEPDGTEFVSVRDAEDPQLDSIAAIDEWRTSHAAMVARMREGHACHVARRGPEVVAVTWSTRGDTYNDQFLGRQLVLGPHETYGWGTHCVPSCRRQNVVPRLVDFANRDLAAHHGKTAVIGLVRTRNEKMLRSIAKTGGRVCGRLGFVQVGTWRLHYLFGRKAFARMTNRVYLQRHRPERRG